MEVDNHNQIIYPQNVKKYTGSIYENRSRARAVPNSTIGGQINTTFLVEFLLNCGIRGRW